MPRMLPALVLLLLTAAAAAQPRVGEAAPPLWLEADAAGPAPTLTDLKGRVVVLEFWATWCAPCVAAIPHLNDLATALADEPVTFLSITAEEREAVEPFMLKHPFKTRVVFDDERKTFAAYGLKFIPHTVVIDRDGRIAAITRPDALTEEALRDALAGKALDLPLKIDRPADPDWDKGLPTEDPSSIAHAVLQYSEATGTVTRSMPASGRIQGDGLPWSVLVQLAYGAEPSQVMGEIPSLKDRVFRVSVKAPGNDDAAARQLLKDLLASALGLRAQWQQEERSVLVLGRKPGTAPPQVATSEAMSSMARSGLIEMKHASMAQVARYLGGFAGGKLGVDETGLAGVYDLSLKWTPGDKDSLANALAAYGLELRTEPRVVPILRAGLDAAVQAPAAEGPR